MQVEYLQVEFLQTQYLLKASESMYREYIIRSLRRVFEYR